MQFININQKLLSNTSILYCYYSNYEHTYFACSHAHVLYVDHMRTPATMATMYYQYGCDHAVTLSHIQPVTIVH